MDIPGPQFQKPHCFNRNNYLDSRSLTDETRINLAARLNTLEKQIRMIKRLIEKDNYFEEVIHQISASQAALDTVAFILLEESMKKCVAERIQLGDQTAFDKLLITVEKILKM